MKRTIYRASNITGMTRVFAFLNRKRPIVLALHGVTAENPGHLCNHEGKHLYLPIFTRLMEFVAARYAPVSLGQIVDWLEGGAELPDRAVAVTFDDGYDNVRTQAAPVLARLGVPATLFVTTDFVRDRRMVWTDRVTSALVVTRKTRVTLRVDGETVKCPLRDDGEKIAADFRIRALFKTLADETREAMMDELLSRLKVSEAQLAAVWPDHRPVPAEELRTLPAQGVDVGSHTCGHRILARCTPDEVKREVEESKRLIEEWVGAPCEQFSYPNGRPGDFNELTGRCIRDAGYRCAATTVTHRVSSGENRYEIPRFTLTHNEITLAEFASEVSGFPGFLRFVKRGFRRSE